MARFFQFSLEIKFNALHFIKYIIPRLCSAYAVATLPFTCSEQTYHLSLDRSAMELHIFLMFVGYGFKSPKIRKVHQRS